MALRIAFDLDGVLADMDSELARCTEELFGGSASGLPDLGVSQERQLWRHVETVENFWERLPELEEGAVRRLAGIADERRWEVIFITTRPSTAGATVQVQSQRWLQAKGFPLPSVYVVYGSRGKVASALNLDVVVDDRLDNCLDVIADSTARPILFVDASRQGRLSAGAKRLGIAIVQTMEECLGSLTQLETPEPDNAGLVARVMRTLGLSDSPK
ncbi:MAG TPA: hypothetical protein VF219_14655 [Vicinamibacterales bacterium]